MSNWLIHNCIDTNSKRNNADDRTHGQSEHFDPLCLLGHSSDRGRFLSNIFPVAECTKPFIQRDCGFSIITFEVSMMEIMKIRACGDLPIADRSVEAMMTTCRGERSVLGVEEQVEGMSEDKHMRQYD